MSKTRHKTTQKSRKSAKDRARQKLMRQYAIEERIFCEYPSCNKMAGDVHEIKPRSAGGDYFSDAQNCMPICREHHRHIHDEPEKHYKMGLLKSRYDNGSFYASGVEAFDEGDM